MRWETHNESPLFQGVHIRSGARGVGEAAAEEAGDECHRGADRQWRVGLPLDRVDVGVPLGALSGLAS